MTGIPAATANRPGDGVSHRAQWPVVIPSRLAIVAFLWLVAMPGGAWASTQARIGTGAKASVSLSATVSPERLGSATAVSTSLQITPARGRAALPVSEVQLLYPVGLGFGSSELGLEECLPSRLQARGPAGCPANSLVGDGSAVVEVPFGPRVVREQAPMRIFSQPVSRGRIGLLFVAMGRSPVIANLAFSGFVAKARSPFGGLIETILPPIASVPKGPNVAIVGLRTTIGSRSIVYHERVHGKVLAFHPKGMLLPRHCPRGGFPFAVHVKFSDDSTATARTAVRCP
jgi:hypothetical protein